MKSHVTVILEHNPDLSIEAQLMAELEKYRQIETSEGPVRTNCWNSWVYYQDEETKDDKLRAAYPSEANEVLSSACYVRHLPSNYETSGVIIPEGRWWDLQDSGWNIDDEPSAANDKCYWRWLMTLKSLFNQYEDCVAVQIMVQK